MIYGYFRGKKRKGANVPFLYVITYLSNCVYLFRARIVSRETTGPTAPRVTRNQELYETEYDSDRPACVGVAGRMLKDC